VGRRVLVTGGAGFIGNHIATHLLGRGDSVNVLDNFSTGRRENLAEIKNDINLVEGDLRNTDDVKKAVAGCEGIIHLAAIPSVIRSVEDPMSSHQANATGTLNLLLAARDAGVRRIVSASSSSVYGDDPEMPKREDMMPNPLSPYAGTKIMLEYYQKMFTQLYGLETVALRYFNVFGPKQDPSSQYSAVIPLFITRLQSGNAPIIFGDGEQSRDFTYIDNVIEANMLALEAEGAPGKVFNIACSVATSVNELYGEIAKLVGSDIKPEYAPTRPGEIRDSLADITQAGEVLGFTPGIDLIEGLKRTVKSFMEQQ
jgi:UDP-N-acetylglucosamine/UDP-N-acetyl-alpha-D-glucosaminouronate 4-epimerase